MTTREDILSLAPCPFCNDPMENSASIIRHVHQGDCIIGQLAYDETKRDRWNGRAAPTPPAAEAPADWQDDPSSDERWNAGLDYHAQQLCAVLGVDPKTVSRDAATEELEGDVRSVIGNILTAAMGESWMDRPAAEAPGQEPVADEIALVNGDRKAREIARVMRAIADEEERYDGISYEAIISQDLSRNRLEQKARAAILGMDRSAPPTYADAEARIAELEKVIEEDGVHMAELMTKYEALLGAEAKGFERGIEAAANFVDRIEGERIPVSCPDGIRGCLVAHFRIKPGPIATAIRSLASPAPKEQGQ